MLPRDVGISRAFNSRAMALADSTPAFRSFRIVEASALARRSAARVCALPILILPFVIRPTRASTLATVVRCHFPPRVVGTLLRFNSFASARWEMKPVAISVRMVGSKASAWAAGRLFAEALLRDAISSPTRSIEPSWPGFATATDVKSVSRSLRAAGHVATYSSVSSEIKRPFLRLTPPAVARGFFFQPLSLSLPLLPLATSASFGTNVQMHCDRFSGRHENVGFGHYAICSGWLRHTSAVGIRAQWGRRPQRPKRMIKHASGSWRPARNIKKSVYSYRPSTARSPPSSCGTINP